MGSSNSVSFSDSNGGSSAVEWIKNANFESGVTSWTQISGVILSSSKRAHAGSWKAWLDGYGSAYTGYVQRQISIPSGVSTARLAFYPHIGNAETGSTAYDTMLVQVVAARSKQITRATYSSNDAAGGYKQHAINLNDYKGQILQINFFGSEDCTRQTLFVVDDASVKTQ